MSVFASPKYYTPLPQQHIWCLDGTQCSVQKRHELLQKWSRGRPNTFVGQWLPQIERSPLGGHQRFSCYSCPQCSVCRAEHFQPVLPGMSMYSSRGNKKTVESFDISLQSNLQEIDKTDWDRLIRVRPRKFRWKSDPDREVYGFVAQELQPVYPQMVKMVDSKNKLYSVDYQQMIPLLTDRVNSISKQVTPSQLCIEGTCVTQKDLIALKNLS